MGGSEAILSLSFPLGEKTRGAHSNDRTVTKARTQPREKGNVLPFGILCILLEGAGRL